MCFSQIVHRAISDAIAQSLKLTDDNNVHLGLLLHDERGSAWSLLFLRALFEHEVFRPEDFRRSVMQAVLNWGIEMHTQVVNGAYPDHVPSPAALAYAIKSGKVTYRQAQKIQFDHGETLEQFKSRADGLIDEVLRKLSGPS